MENSNLFNPESIYKLQLATRNGDYKTFKEYTNLINNQEDHLCTIRSMLKFKTGKFNSNRRS